MLRIRRASANQMLLGVLGSSGRIHTDRPGDQDASFAHELTKVVIFAGTTSESALDQDKHSSTEQRPPSAILPLPHLHLPPLRRSKRLASLRFFPTAPLT